MALQRRPSDGGNGFIPQLDRARATELLRRAVDKAQPQVDNRAPAALSQQLPPIGKQDHARKQAAVQAAVADRMMILNIAREMGRPNSLSTLDRKGPASLNLDKRRRELRRVDSENAKMLKRLEQAKPSYKAKEQKKSYDKSRQHAAIASHKYELPSNFPVFGGRQSVEPTGQDDEEDELLDGEVADGSLEQPAPNPSSLPVIVPPGRASPGVAPRSSSRSRPPQPPQSASPAPAPREYKVAVPPRPDRKVPSSRSRQVSRGASPDAAAPGREAGTSASPAPGRPSPGRPSPVRTSPSPARAAHRGAPSPTRGAPSPTRHAPSPSAFASGSPGAILFPADLCAPIQYRSIVSEPLIQEVTPAQASARVSPIAAASSSEPVAVTQEPATQALASVVATVLPSPESVPASYAPSATSAEQLPVAASSPSSPCAAAADDVEERRRRGAWSSIPNEKASPGPSPTASPKATPVKPSPAAASLDVAAASAPNQEVASSSARKPPRSPTPVVASPVNGVWNRQNLPEMIAATASSPAMSSAAKPPLSPLPAAASPVQRLQVCKGFKCKGCNSNTCLSSAKAASPIPASKQPQSPLSLGASPERSVEITTAKPEVAATAAVAETATVDRGASREEAEEEKSVSETYGEEEFCDYDDDFDEASEDAEEGASPSGSASSGKGAAPASPVRAVPGKPNSSESARSATSQRPASVRSAGLGRSAASAQSAGSARSRSRSPESPKSARSASTSSVGVPCNADESENRSAHDSDEDED